MWERSVGVRITGGEKTYTSMRTIRRVGITYGVRVGCGKQVTQPIRGMNSARTSVDKYM